MYRKSTLDDCEAIHRLICDMECRNLSYERFYEIYCDQLKNRHYYCLVTERDHRVIGVLNLRFEEQLHHVACIAEIMEFAVDSGFRNQGIGKGMLEEACRIAKMNDCTQIEVACNQLRKDTHRFYLREGLQNHHYKFSKSLTGGQNTENAIGR